MSTTNFSPSVPSIGMSDSDFDDDDDEAVLQLMRATQRPVFRAENGLLAPELTSSPELFRAQGEIAILRAQLESIQKLKSEDASRLLAQLLAAKETAKDQIEALRLSVQKLEDEKRFLRNEVKSLSSVKRRKVEPVTAEVLEKTGALDAPGTKLAPPKGRSEVPIQIQDDWLQLSHHLWHYTINGSDRSTMEILLRVCLRETVDIGGHMCFVADSPLLTQVWARLMELRLLRLDNIVNDFCELVLALVHRLLDGYSSGKLELLLSVPFLLSLVYGAVSFKPLAVREPLAVLLIGSMGRIAQQFVFVLQLNDEEEEALLGHENVTYQQRLLENFTLIVSMDVLELLTAVFTSFGASAVRSMWQNHVINPDLLLGMMPENSERFVATFQVNVVFNVVELLFSSVTESGFATGDVHRNKTLINTLIKTFLVDIDMKEDFLFYGLNRVCGNNDDFCSISAVVPPELPAFLNVSYTAVPCPVDPPKRTEKQRFHVLLTHDAHLLNLRIRVATLLEQIVVCGMSDLVNLQENLKLMVRVINFEQNLVMQQPRYPYVHMRLEIITVLVRLLYYLIDEHKSVNTLIYPETLYEILVVLMRIAFGSDSLSSDAQKILTEVRRRGAVNMEVFNRACELRSRELAHINVFEYETVRNGQLADVEGDYANGLEFPYDSETIEIAREILAVCLSHDEADNLYYNMTSQGP